MNIGLIDVDSHNFPNLPLMKLSAYHKGLGDHVEMWNGFKHYDKVYMAKVFTDEYTPTMDYCINADEVVTGGTGFDLINKLPNEVEHQHPDYSLYNTEQAYGFLTRGCPRSCGFCIVSQKEGLKSYKVADLSEFWKGQKEIKLLDPNLLACKDHMDLLDQLAQSKAYIDFTQGLDARMLTEDNINAINKLKVKEVHFAWDFMSQSKKIVKNLKLYASMNKYHPHGYNASVYVLTNYDTDHEEDLERIYKLREMNYDPYVMIYNKHKADKQTRDLSRWVNNKKIWRNCERFEDYGKEPK